MLLKQIFETLVDEVSAERRHHVYTRGQNPTVEVLEKRLAMLEGGEACKCLASGMGAVSALLTGLLDLPTLVERARQRGIRVVMDNSWATPWGARHALRALGHILFSRAHDGADLQPEYRAHALWTRNYRCPVR